MPKEIDSTPKPQETRKGVRINLHCEDCVFYTEGHAPKLSDCCSKLNISELAKPCDKFILNMHKLNLHESISLKSLASLVKQLPTEQLKFLAYLLSNEGKNRKQGFQFGEPIAFNLHGGDYANSFAKGRVIACMNDYVHIEGRCGVKATLLQSSCMHLSEFHDYRDTLIASGRATRPVDNTWQEMLADSEPALLDKKGADKLNKELDSSPEVPPHISGSEKASKRTRKPVKKAKTIRLRG